MSTPLSLLDMNPYLLDPEQYEKFLAINAESSAAIEVGRTPRLVIQTFSDAERAAVRRPAPFGRSR